MRIPSWANTETNGPWWHHGQAWATLWGDDDRSLGQVGCELVTFSRAQIGGVQLKVGGKHSERFLSGRVGLPRLAVLYWHLEVPRPWYRFLPAESHDTELLVSTLDRNPTVRVTVWKHDEGHWRRSDRWWQRRSKRWYLKDVLWGKGEHSKVLRADPVRVEIPMPERSYPALVSLYDQTWRYRFGRTVTSMSAHLEILTDNREENGYIPVPGRLTI